MKQIHYFSGNDRIEVQEVEGRFRISRCIEIAQERAPQINAEYYQIFEESLNGEMVQVTDLYFVNARRENKMTDKKEATNKAIESYNVSIKAMEDTIQAINVTIDRLNKGDLTLKSAKTALPITVCACANLPIDIKNEVKALDANRTKALYIAGLDTCKGNILSLIKLANDTIENIKEAEKTPEKVETPVKEETKKEDKLIALDTDKLSSMAVEIKKNIETALNLHFANGKLLKEALDMHKDAGKPASEWIEWANTACNVKKAQAYNLVGIYNRFGQDTEYKDTSMRVLNILVHTGNDLYKKIEEECKALAVKGKLDTKAVNRLLDSYAPAKPVNTLIGYHGDKKVCQNNEGYKIEGDLDTYANKSLLFEKHEIKTLTASPAPAKVADPVDNTSKAIQASLDSDIQVPVKEDTDDKDKLIAELREQNLALLARIDELAKALNETKSKPVVEMPMLPQFSASEPHLVLGISPIAGKVEINARYRIMALIFNAKTCPDGARALKAAKDALIKRAE